MKLSSLRQALLASSFVWLTDMLKNKLNKRSKEV